MSHWLEILGFLTGVSCVLLGIAQIHWSWPVGLAFNVILFIVFGRHGIYALAILQLVYIAIGIYGWWNWLHGGIARGELKISRTPPYLALLLMVIAVFGAFLIHAILVRYTASTIPWLDSITTTLSLVAQYLLSRKLMGTWYVFAVVDVIAIVINLEKHLYPIIALYVFFLGLCVYGFWEWNKSLRQHSAAS